MNVNFTSKMSKLLGKYGPFETGYAFEPVINQRLTEVKDTLKTARGNMDTMYRAMIMKSNKERIMTYTAYSFLDLISASGGIISGMLAVAAPIAAIFSSMSWNLGVMRLLFMAKKDGQYKHVAVSNWQFLRLYWQLYGPWTVCACLSCIFCCFGT